MEMMSVGPVLGGPAQLEHELRSASVVVHEPKLVLLYLPIDVEHGEYLAAARRALAVPVVGATTGGAAFTERGVTRRDAVAAVLGGPHSAFEIAIARELVTDAAAKIEAAATELVGKAEAARVRAPAILTLCDAFACDGDVLLGALRRATPPHWRHFGGTAGDNWTFTGTRVFAGDEVLEDAAVLVGVFGSMPPVLAAYHGFCPAPGGRDLVVTESFGNTIYALDGRPAAEVYREELERLGLLCPGADLVPAMATYELGVAGEPDGCESYQIRAPMGVNPGGSIVLASALPQGAIVRVMAADPDRIIAAARELGRRAARNLEGEIRGALVFDCAARLQLLGARYPEQVDAFLDGRRFPCVGMACYGEIAKFGGSLEGFHNTTAAIAAW
jgi:hypothetical protein